MTAISEVLSSVEERMKKALVTAQKEFGTIRTGRANPGILDRVDVDYYGTPTPLKNLANISTSDGRSLLIQPWDKGVIKEIEKAIAASGLGLTATNDGSVVRINIPVLTEDRRKELTKIVKKYAEEARVAIRNIRRDGLDDLKKLKGTQVSEDELKRQEEGLQKLTDRYIKDVDKMTQDKEAEIMEV